MTTAPRLLLLLPQLACGVDSRLSGRGDESVVAMAKLAPSGDGTTGGLARPCRFRSASVGSAGVAGSLHSFQATVLPGSSTDLSLLSGGGQVQDQPPLVRVSDAFSDLVPGVTVQWTVVTWTGTPQTPTSLPQCDGLAASTLEAEARPALS